MGVIQRETLDADVESGVELGPVTVALGSDTSGVAVVMHINSM